jgi:thioredoxin reductase
MTRARDVVVVGSGHNGLVAAAYLARAGRPAHGRRPQRSHSDRHRQPINTGVIP